MSDMTVRSSISHTASSFVEGCVSFVRPRQILVGCVALAALSALSYVLYRHLMTKRDSFTTSNRDKQNKIEKQLSTRDSEKAEKERLELQELKKTIQEVASARQSNNHAILLGLPYYKIDQIKLYRRLDLLVQEGEIHAWSPTNRNEVIINLKENDINPRENDPYFAIWCSPTGLKNNRWGWRDRELVSLEEAFRKAHPLKAIDPAILAKLTPQQQQSIENVLTELEARGKAGACETYSGPEREFALSFLKDQGVIHDFETTSFYSEPYKAFVTTQDKEIETEIRALPFPPDFSSRSFHLHRDISNAYRQRWTEGTTSAFILFNSSNKELDELVRAGTISWRYLKRDGNRWPILVRFKEDDPVEQTEEDFDNTEYSHRKAGWRTQALLAEEEGLRQKNQLNITAKRIQEGFYDKHQLSESDKQDCQQLIDKLNTRVQIGPYIIGSDRSWGLRKHEIDLIKFLEWGGCLKKIEWLEDGNKTTCIVWVREHDLNPQSASS